MITAEQYLDRLTSAVRGMAEIVAGLGDDVANRKPPVPGANSPYVLLHHSLEAIRYWAGEVVAGRPAHSVRNSEFSVRGPVGELLDRVEPALHQLTRDLESRDTDIDGALLQVYTDVVQHLGQLEITRDVLAAFRGGAFPPGQAGILDGRRATTHRAVGQDFRDRFPLACLETNQAFVDDGPVHTSSGILSTADLALTWLRAHLHEPLTLARIAAHAHVSERGLVRKFREATGMSVFGWINQERVNQAKILLESTGHRVADIAVMVGFGSAETLRRHFERHVGATASAYRAKFR
jgi:AraC-like DNA-binding protein